MNLEIEDEFADRVKELLWYLRDRKEQKMNGSIEFNTDKEGKTHKGIATLHGGFATLKRK